MNLRVVLAVVGALLVGGVVLLLWPKQELSPEQQVRAMIAQCVKAAEDHDVGGITEHIAEDFKGPSGTRKQDVKQVLLGQLFRQPKDLLVMNPELSVTMESSEAGTFSGMFVFARPGQNWNAPGSGVSKYDISGRVEKRGDEWFFVSAEWKQ